MRYVVATMPLSMPLADLSRHSEEELRRMESDEREALEARIQWIRDIQTLIDSAVEQMHQYTLVCTDVRSYASCLTCRSILSNN